MNLQPMGVRMRQVPPEKSKIIIRGFP